MKDALVKTAGLTNHPWIKLPYGTWNLLSQSGYTSNEMLIVIFFYHKLCHNPLPESTIVYATSKEIMNYACITRSVFYGAIEKMCKKGMVRVEVNTYDMKGFLEKMEVRGDMYLGQVSCLEKL